MPINKLTCGQSTTDDLISSFNSMVDVVDNVGDALVEGDKVSSSLDNTEDKLLITGSGGVLGSSPEIDQIETPNTGTSCASGQLTHLESVNLGFPDLGLDDEIPVFWIVESWGQDTRLLQRVTQIFRNEAQRDTFKRVRHDTIWSSWIADTTPENLGSSAILDIVSNPLDYNQNKVLITGSGGILGNSPSATNPDTIGNGTFTLTGEITHLESVSLGYPDLGLTDSDTVCWSVTTQGDSVLKSQDITQIYNNSFGNYKFYRNLQGGSWGGWVRISTGDNQDLGTSASLDVITSALDTTSNRVLRTGAGGILSNSPTVSNLDTISPGTQVTLGQIDHSVAVSYGAPDLGLSDTDKVWWNISTTGSSTRTTQEATQVFRGVHQGVKYTRVKHDTLWSDWSLFVTSSNIQDFVNDSGGVAVSEYKSVTQMMASANSSYTVGDHVRTSGYTGDDGGWGEWVLTAATGTASQPPANLGLPRFTDTEGKVWELVYKDEIVAEQLGGLPALQIALDTLVANVTLNSNNYNLDKNASYTIHSFQRLRGRGLNKTFINIHADSDDGYVVFKNSDVSSDGSRTSYNVCISDFTFKGTNWTGYKPWLTSSSGNPVTDPEADYEPNGIIGQGGDIFDVVAAGRRNGNYRARFSVAQFDKCRNPVMERVRLQDCSGFGFLDRGCLSMRVRNCEFINHGRIDDISSPVWTGSLGNSSAPYYAPSVDHVTEHCYFECKRSAISLGPFGGGEFRYNNVAFTGESAVFCGAEGASVGGILGIHHNKFGPSVITDLVVSHVETNGNNNVYIYNNEFSESEGHSISTMSGENVFVYNNVFRDNVADRVVTKPYGPFSERYTYGVGAIPVAGDELIDQSVWQTGSYTDVGAVNHQFKDNVIIDTRATSPLDAIAHLSRGGHFLSKNIKITGNNLMGVIDSTVPTITSLNNVMSEAMTITTKDNLGGGDENPIVLQETISSTGDISLECGFCPSTIEVYATTASTTGQTWVSKVIHNQTENATTTGARVGSRNGILDNQVISLSNSSGTILNNTVLSSWNLTGVTLNVQISTATCEVRFICYP